MGEGGKGAFLTTDIPAPACRIDLQPMQPGAGSSRTRHRPPLPAYTSNTQTNVWVLYELDYSPVELFSLSTHVCLLPDHRSRLVGTFSSFLAASPSVDEPLTMRDQDRFDQVTVSWHRHTLGLAALLQILQGGFNLVVVHRVVQKF